MRAGAARRALVLPAKIPLAGYSRRHGRPSTGAHDPLSVRALVVEDGEHAAALVSCDLLVIDEQLAAAVRERLRARGLSRDLVLLLAATHTHSGPGAYGARYLERISMGHFDPAVFEALADQIADTVETARAGLAPVRIAYGAAATEGLVRNRVMPDGPVDPELRVLACYRGQEAEPFAILLNFSAHPTALGAWNRELSADYPGVAMRAVEAAHPSTIAFFFAGGVGDQGPVKSGSGYETAERIGQALATSAGALLKEMRPAPAQALHAAQRELRLPPAAVRLGRLRLPRWLGRRLVDDDATVTAVRIDQLAVLGVPCDLASSLGGELRAGARAQGVTALIADFANDYVGYCIPSSSYAARQYESSMAFNGPDAGELIVRELLALLRELGS